MGASRRGAALPPEYPPDTRVHQDLAAFVDFLLQREEQASLKLAV
jgi:D-glycero-D-manno-heptose 1,7-bisphosphate phosphatase